MATTNISIRMDSDLKARRLTRKTRKNFAKSGKKRKIVFDKGPCG